VFASVMFAESVPQVGFWQSLTIVVLFSQSVDKPCDRPLASWLTGLIALYFYWFNSLMPGPCSVHNLLARLLCCWRPRAVHIMTVAIAGRPVEVVRIARPRRVKLWDLLVVLLGVCWLCFGVSLVATADTCKETAAELYYSSKLLLIALVSLLLTWLLALIPPNIVQYGIWMGFWKTEFAAPTGCLGDQKVVDYSPELFGSESATPECHICLGEFTPDTEIRMTTCGHVFHAECLGEWFRMARTCPICRSDLARRGPQLASLEDGVVTDAAEGGYNHTYQIQEGADVPEPTRIGASAEG